MRKPILILMTVMLLSASLLMSREKIGIALSGGGARCLAHIGVLKVLDEYGIVPDQISGTSMGAVIATFYALGWSPDEISALFEEEDWRHLLTDTISREDYYTGEKRWGPNANYYFRIDDNFNPQLPRSFLSGNRVLMELFELTYPYADETSFDSLAVPLRIVATDIETGKPVIFRDGALHEVLLASLTFPSVLAPFKTQGHYCADGGIVMNLPIQALDQSDICIGVKTNSSLKPTRELDDVIDVLNQSMNINMIWRMEQAMPECNLLICPKLDDVGLFDFDQKERIIAAGEKAAREKIDSLLELWGQNGNKKSRFQPKINGSVLVTGIEIEGNYYMSSSKIREYASIRAGNSYTLPELVRNFERAYNSRLFEYIYPVLTPDDGGYRMIIRVKENERRKLGLNARYNNTDELTIGGSLEYTNYLQRNSKLIVNLDMGGIQEINVDYVKNFGKLWGVYFRVFPYIRYERFFLYDDMHEKTGSIRSRESGMNLGVGMFAAFDTIIEGFVYSYQRQFYRDVSAKNYVESFNRSTGVGIKAYSETYDDFMIPMRGRRIMMKFISATDDFYSDASYERYLGRLTYVFPLKSYVSLIGRFEYGAYLHDQTVDFDPFFIGGYDSYVGFNEKEYSAPNYKITSGSVRFALPWNLYLDLQMNGTKYGNVDDWRPTEDMEWGYGVKLAYKSFLGPVRGGVGFHADRKPVYYLSVGYDIDAFEFSRR